MNTYYITITDIQPGEGAGYYNISISGIPSGGYRGEGAGTDELIIGHVGEFLQAIGVEDRFSDYKVEMRVRDEIDV